MDSMNKLRKLKKTAKEVKIMMAMLFVINIAKGKRTFASVPAFLKEQVKECLIDMDLEHLAHE